MRLERCDGRAANEGHAQRPKLRPGAGTNEVDRFAPRTCRTTPCPTRPQHRARTRDDASSKALLLLLEPLVAATAGDKGGVSAGGVRTPSGHDDASGLGPCLLSYSAPSSCPSMAHVAA